MCVSEIWREAADKVSLTQGKALLWGFVKGTPTADDATRSQDMSLRSL